MSTRTTIWLSPEIDEVAIHVYKEMLNDWIYVDISRGYGFHFRIAPRWRLVRSWVRRAKGARA